RNGVRAFEIGPQNPRVVVRADPGGQAKDKDRLRETTGVQRRKTGTWAYGCLRPTSSCLATIRSQPHAAGMTAWNSGLFGPFVSPQPSVLSIQEVHLGRLESELTQKAGHLPAMIGLVLQQVDHHPPEGIGPCVATRAYARNGLLQGALGQLGKIAHHPL